MVSIFKCRICDNSDNNKNVIATERMYGMGGEFNYIECSKCGCLQIEVVPTDMSKYYPIDSYYSYEKSKGIFEDKVRLTIKYFLIKYKLHCPKKIKNFFSNTLIGQVYKFIDIFQDLGISYNSKILDVGCGNGKLLLALHHSGFNNITGIDPFISSSINYENGVSIDKLYLKDVVESYDLVMLNHSFEHMENQLESMKNIHRILKKLGYALIGVPLASSFAYEHYGAEWVQLDAPRHFYLHTSASMSLIARKAGFQVVDIVFDSTSLQFTGSEKYRNGLTLEDKTRLFTSVELRSFKDKAKELNKKSQGDQAYFVLFKP